MHKSPFKFPLHALVLVPATNRQGEVMRRIESIDQEPEYKLHWQNAGHPRSGWFSESAVVAVNTFAPAASKK